MNVHCYASLRQVCEKSFRTSDTFFPVTRCCPAHLSLMWGQKDLSTRVTETPSPRIWTHLKPPTFLCGFTFRPHVWWARQTNPQRLQSTLLNGMFECGMNPISFGSQIWSNLLNAMAYQNWFQSLAWASNTDAKTTRWTFCLIQRCQPLEI